jgi:putative cell wall-binding protein
MTPAQIESAARNLCQLRNYGAAMENERYAASVMERLRKEVQDFCEVGTAISAAMEQDNTAKLEQAEQRIRSMLLEDPNQTHYDRLKPTPAPPRAPRKRKEKQA